MNIDLENIRTDPSYSFSGWSAHSTSMKLIVLDQIASKVSTVLFRLLYDRWYAFARNQNKNTPMYRHLIHLGVIKETDFLICDEGNGQAMSSPFLSHACSIYKHVDRIAATRSFDLDKFLANPTCQASDQITLEDCNEVVEETLFCVAHAAEIHTLLEKCKSEIEKGTAQIVKTLQRLQTFEAVCDTVRELGWHPYGPDCTFGGCSNSGYEHFRKEVDSCTLAKWLLSDTPRSWGFVDESYLRHTWSVFKNGTLPPYEPGNFYPPAYDSPSHAQGSNTPDDSHGSQSGTHHESASTTAPQPHHLPQGESASGPVAQISAGLEIGNSASGPASQISFLPLDGNQRHHSAAPSRPPLTRNQPYISTPRSPPPAYQAVMDGTANETDTVNETDPMDLS